MQKISKVDPKLNQWPNVFNVHIGCLYMHLGSFYIHGSKGAGKSLPFPNIIIIFLSTANDYTFALQKSGITLKKNP